MSTMRQDMTVTLRCRDADDAVFHVRSWKEENPTWKVGGVMKIVRATDPKDTGGFVVSFSVERWVDLETGESYP